jgi:hypothetical protein
MKIECSMKKDIACCVLDSGELGIHQLWYVVHKRGK